MNQSVVNGTVIFSSEPFHGFFLWDSMLGSDSGFASSSKANSASWSFKDDVKVHTENTGEWIILDTQINVLLNTETETSSIWEVGFSQFSVLDFKSSFKNFISLVSSDSDVSGNFLVSLNTETSDGESGSWWDGFLSGKIFQDFGCWVIKRVIPLVSLSPDYPTEMLRTIFSILIYLIGFYFSTFEAIWVYGY